MGQTSKIRAARRNAQSVLLLFTSVILVSGMSCVKPARSGALIEAYGKADCVMPIIAPWVVSPPTRGWDATVTIPGGSKATIKGAQMVSGRIEVRYEADGQLQTAAKPGDYVYPSDVRLNAALGRLYVKASGLAAGIWHETWLYEYDLQKRKQLTKRRVDPAVLQPECELKK